MNIEDLGLIEATMMILIGKCNPPLSSVLSIVRTQPCLTHHASGLVSTKLNLQKGVSIDDHARLKLAILAMAAVVALGRAPHQQKLPRMPTLRMPKRLPQQQLLLE